MPMAIEEIVPHQLLDVSENGGVGRGVQPVATEVQPMTMPLEAPGVPPAYVRRLEHRHGGLPVSGELIGAASPRRPRPEDRDARLTRALAFAHRPIAMREF
jgi:hypothetical protein